ncbi:hypothetical protein HK098_006470, partial [Nowakowskiella sp. JEL0407]
WFQQQTQQHRPNSSISSTDEGVLMGCYFAKEARNIEKYLKETGKQQAGQTTIEWMDTTKYQWEQAAQNFLTVFNPFSVFNLYKNAVSEGIQIRMDSAAREAGFTAISHPFKGRTSVDLLEEVFRFMGRCVDKNAEKNEMHRRMKNIRIVETDTLAQITTKMHSFLKDATSLKIKGEDSYNRVRKLFEKWEDERKRMVRLVNKMGLIRINEGKERSEMEFSMEIGEYILEDFISAFHHWHEEHSILRNDDDEEAPKAKGKKHKRDEDNSESNKGKKPKLTENFFAKCLICGRNHKSKEGDHTSFKKPKEEKWKDSNWTSLFRSNLKYWKDGKLDQMKNLDGNLFPKSAFQSSTSSDK